MGIFGILLLFKSIYFLLKEKNIKTFITKSKYHCCALFPLKGIKILGK